MTIRWEEKDKYYELIFLVFLKQLIVLAMAPLTKQQTVHLHFAVHIELIKRKQGMRWASIMNLLQSAKDLK